MTTTHLDPHGTAPGADAVDFTVVARVLADAAVLVHTRGELGERPSRDRRPRIRAAITRAADLAGIPAGVAGRPVRDWAVWLAAMQINAALGRGRHRDRGDVAASAFTLDGFGLDVGTLGAVDTAADLVSEAAGTAERIAAAGAVPVYGHGPVIAYHLGPVRAAEVEVDDIIAVNPSGAVGGGEPRNLRVRAIRVTAADGRIVALDTPTGSLELPAEEVTAGTGWCTSVWRPVPHLPHPWQPHSPH